MSKSTKFGGRTSTEDFQRVDLLDEYLSRDASFAKDFRLFNMYPEFNQMKKQVTFIKRPGLSYFSNPPTTTAAGRGCYFWSGSKYSVFANKLYKDTTEVKTLATSTGMVGWCEFEGTTDYLILCDGTDGYYIASDGTTTEIADADFPSPHIPCPVFIDGYIFLAKSNTGDIYNCELDTPTSWVATDFISAEMFPDNLSALNKVNNQLVALGKSSLEWFSINPAQSTGSPLARNEGAAHQVGCASQTSVAQIEKQLYFVGQANAGGRSVFEIKGYELTRISNDGIDKLLNSDDNTDATVSIGYVVKSNGHTFYVLNLNSSTHVYDVYNKVWHEWTSNDGSAAHGRFNGVAVLDTTDGLVYVQGRTDGNIYAFDPDTYQDSISSGSTRTILAEIRTNNFDNGNLKRKRIYDFTINCDQTSTSSNISVYWTDDDYQNWSSAYTLDRSVYAKIPSMGYFRRRAFKLLYTDNYALRIQGIEFELRQGIH